MKKDKAAQYTYNEKKNKNSIIQIIIGVCFLLCGVGVISYFLLQHYTTPEIVYQPPIIERSEPESSSKPEPEEDYYPVGKLIVASNRELYIDGDIELYIPRLELLAPVLGDTEEETLKSGLGLFDYSQLPGSMDQNGNVSIAGHRDIFGKEFYFIDTVELGDLIYLTYQGELYTYEVERTFITNPYDWDPIRVREYPCITLQSCTPIGIASERIFVVGRLIDVTSGGVFPLPDENTVDSLPAQNPV